MSTARKTGAPAKKSAKNEVQVLRRPSVRALAGMPSTTTIRRRALLMMSALQLNNCSLSILLTDDDEIAELNGTYRGKQKPTDVLSFAMREGELASLAGGTLGDIVLSLPTAARQARQGHRKVLDESTLLLAHGLLHLLGYDHQTAEDDKRMRKRADELCVAAGSPPLFALGGVSKDGVAKPARTRQKTTAKP